MFRENLFILGRKSLLYSINESGFKIIINLGIKSKIVKLIEENMGENFCDLEVEGFLKKILKI